MYLAHFEKTFIQRKIMTNGIFPTNVFATEKCISINFEFNKNSLSWIRNEQITSESVKGKQKNDEEWPYSKVQIPKKLYKLRAEFELDKETIAT